jgi:Predicted metalloendopeptidase
VLTAATARAQAEPQKSPALATATPPPNVQTAGKIPAEKSPPPLTSPVAQTQGEITSPTPEDKNPPPPFDTANMDTSVKPCDDFFLYANGAWIKRTPIPPEYSRWGSFNQLIEKNTTRFMT